MCGALWQREIEGPLRSRVPAQPLSLSLSVSRSFSARLPPMPLTLCLAPRLDSRLLSRFACATSPFPVALASRSRPRVRLPSCPSPCLVPLSFSPCPLRVPRSSPLKQQLRGSLELASASPAVSFLSPVSCAFDFPSGTLLGTLLVWRRHLLLVRLWLSFLARSQYLGGRHREPRGPVPADIVWPSCEGRGVGPR